MDVNDQALDWLLWLIRLLAVGAFGLAMWLRDKVKQILQELHGPDGKNGYRQDIRELEDEVNHLIRWMEAEQVREKTITEIEQELMHDVGRSRSRRLRDELNRRREDNDPNSKNRPA